MPILVGFVVALIGWALWTRRLTVAQLPPLVLAVAGAGLVLKGQFLIGIAALAIAGTWYRGLRWRLFGTGAKQSRQYDIDQARWLLGVSVHDDASRIRECHRKLIADNHPDKGGSQERAKELNKARDLLLHEIESNPR